MSFLNLSMFLGDICGAEGVTEVETESEGGLLWASLEARDIFSVYKKELR